MILGLRSLGELSLGTIPEVSAPPPSGFLAAWANRRTHVIGAGVH